MVPPDNDPPPRSLLILLILLLQSLFSISPGLFPPPQVIAGEPWLLDALAVVLGSRWLVLVLKNGYEWFDQWLNYG